MRTNAYSNQLHPRCARGLRLLALSFALGFTTGGLAIGQDFTTIDYPGATQTWAYGINDSGDIVGGYSTSGGPFSNPKHGFLLSAGKFTAIDYPGAKLTFATGINSQGVVVGIYVDATGNQHGFVLNKGTLTALDYPGATSTGACGINAAGDIVGVFGSATQGQGFLLKHGAWTVLDYRPKAAGNVATGAYGINDAGVIVGVWTTRGNDSGFVYGSSKGDFTELNYGPGDMSEVYGINNAGDIVGIWDNATGSQLNHAFVVRDGRFTPFDVPLATNSQGMSINNAGQIAGWFTSGNGSAMVAHGFFGRVAPAGPPPPVLTVDDDGAECPGALRTIQEAIAKAPVGATILVCPGTYRGTVNIIGPEKTGLRLIGVGLADEVVLRGDYSQRDGFHLENVSNVLIRGFTVRDFGQQATTANTWGDGNQIYLENAHFNTIEQNRIINGDMMGIMLNDSGDNVIQYNLAWVNNNALANCAIHVQGAKSARNVLQQNFTYGHKVAGIMLANAGPGNRVMNNITTNNGRDGVTNTGTDGTWIEGNRASYNRGPWGTSPYPPEAKNVGRGITIGGSNGVTVIDNRGRGNSGTDINWDGSGDVKFNINACDTSMPALVCVSATPGSAGTIPAAEAEMNPPAQQPLARPWFAPGRRAR